MSDNKKKLKGIGRKEFFVWSIVNRLISNGFGFLIWSQGIAHYFFILVSVLYVITQYILDTKRLQNASSKPLFNHIFSIIAVSPLLVVFLLPYQGDSLNSIFTILHIIILFLPSQKNTDKVETKELESRALNLPTKEKSHKKNIQYIIKKLNNQNLKILLIGVIVGSLVFLMYYLFIRIPLNEKDNKENIISTIKSDCHNAAINEAVRKWQHSIYPETKVERSTYSGTLESRFQELLGATEIPRKYNRNDYEEYYKMCLREKGI